MADKTDHGRALTFDDKMFNLQRFSEKMMAVQKSG